MSSCLWGTPSRCFAVPCHNPRNASQTPGTSRCVQRKLKEEVSENVLVKSGSLVEGTRQARFRLEFPVNDLYGHLTLLRDVISSLHGV